MLWSIVGSKCCWIVEFHCFIVFILIKLRYFVWLSFLFKFSDLLWVFHNVPNIFLSILVLIEPFWCSSHDYAIQIIWVAFIVFNWNLLSLQLHEAGLFVLATGSKLRLWDWQLFQGLCWVFLSVNVSIALTNLSIWERLDFEFIFQCLFLLLVACFSLAIKNSFSWVPPAKICSLRSALHTFLLLLWVFLSLAAIVLPSGWRINLILAYFSCAIITAISIIFSIRLRCVCFLLNVLLILCTYPINFSILGTSLDDWVHVFAWS